ncbi:MAG: hypothetical protein PF480_03880, partial [Roseovarius sp.]|nr:hypothetical protein [Roseovarius sp.]
MRPGIAFGPGQVGGGLVLRDSAEQGVAKARGLGAMGDGDLPRLRVAPGGLATCGHDEFLDGGDG